MINSNFGFTPLKEVWIGDCYPESYYDHLPNDVADPFRQITEWTKEDLNKLQKFLEGKGIIVQRPVFESIDDYYQRWKNDEFDAIFYEWQRLQGYRGRQMCVHKKDGSVVRGVMNDVLPTGDLVLNPDSGEIQNISFCIVETVDISKNGQK